MCRLPRVSHSPSSGFHGSTTAMHSNPLSYVYLHETCYKTERISGDCEHKMCCAIYALASVYPFNVSKTFTDEYLKRKCLELMHNQLLPLPYELIAKLCNTPASSEFIWYASCLVRRIWHVYQQSFVPTNGYVWPLFKASRTNFSTGHVSLWTLRVNQIGHQSNSRPWTILVRTEIEME